MADRLVSIVLPVHNQADHIRAVVEEYREALRRVPDRYEILLVPNGCRDDSAAVCGALAAEAPDRIRTVPRERGGWGLAVKAGLAAARGDVLCYTNSARTAPEELVLALLYAGAYTGAVIKANRKIREHWTRRLGSLLYNMECRTLFDLSNWDVNGTPKVFPRAFAKLLELTRDDDLIDLEFSVICRRESYPMLEVPIFSHRRHGGRSTTSLRSAVRLYWGAYTMWREAR